VEDFGIARWHLQIRPGSKLVPSDAPVSQDAPFVTKPFDPADTHLGNIRSHTPMQRIIEGITGAAEYGDMETVGELPPVGAYKRAYSTVTDGIWCLTAGFNIGSLDLEWVGQVQTDPIIEGYIEGPPPIPAENYYDKALREVHPSSSIRLLNTNRTVYMYSSRNDGKFWVGDEVCLDLHEPIILGLTGGANVSGNSDAAVGAAWGVGAGFGLVTNISTGHVKAHIKASTSPESAHVLFLGLLFYNWSGRQIGR
jgi:hypothetical protein